MDFGKSHLIYVVLTENFDNCCFDTAGDSSNDSHKVRENQVSPLTQIKYVGNCNMTMPVLNLPQQRPLRQKGTFGTETSPDAYRGQQTGFKGRSAN